MAHQASAIHLRVETCGDVCGRCRRRCWPFVVRDRPLARPGPAVLATVSVRLHARIPRKESAHVDQMCHHPAVEFKRASWLAPVVSGLASGALAGGVAARNINRRLETSAPEDSPASSGHVQTDSVKADELDKDLLGQLHAATLKASDSCFEIKKLCAAVLVPAGTLVSIFTDKKLDASVFSAGLLIVLSFWLADSVGYYYQRKLRDAMSVIWKRRADRCSEVWDPPGARHISPVRAAFNGSMMFYALLATPILLGLGLFATGVISSSSGSSL